MIFPHGLNNMLGTYGLQTALHDLFYAIAFFFFSYSLLVSNSLPLKFSSRYSILVLNHFNQRGGLYNYTARPKKSGITVLFFLGFNAACAPKIHLLILYHHDSLMSNVVQPDTVAMPFCCCRVSMSIIGPSNRTPFI